MHQVDPHLLGHGQGQSRHRALTLKFHRSEEQFYFSPLNGDGFPKNN